MQHERATQTEGALDSSGDLGDLVKRDSSDLEHRRRKGEAKCGLVHGENLVGEKRVMGVGMAKRRSNSDLGRKLSLSKSFSRLLSFRKSKK